MSLVRIDVTAEDIRQGIARDCKRCPVALAVSRALGVEATVGKWSLYYAGSAGVKLPPAAKQWIESFDTTGMTLKPFSFDMQVPE